VVDANNQAQPAIKDRFLEGWTTDRDGRIMIPDVHWSEIGMDPLKRSEVKVKIKAEVFVGTYEKKQVTGKRGDGRNRPPVYDIWRKFKEADIERVSESKNYTYTVNLKIDGSWSVEDTGVGLNKSGTFKKK
jgi:hypothetical protein